MSEWIDINDRLPEKGKPILVGGPDWETLAVYDDDPPRWRVAYFIPDDKAPQRGPQPTHWMPLPAPPKEMAP